MKKLYLPNLTDKIPLSLKKQMQNIISFLKNSYGATPMLVGGAVRDMLLNREIKDLDIECYGIDEKVFHKAMSDLNALGVGKSFFVYKIGDIDISLPRKEKKIAFGHRGFSVSIAKDEKEASRRRDFTINAFLYNPVSGFLYEYWGGIRDIEARLLRVVDKDTFIEDSLRVLRAMQFSSRLGFKIEKSSCFLCKDIPLNDLSKSRIFSEFEKMFNGLFPHYGLYYLESLGVSNKLWGESLDREQFIKAALDMARYIPKENLLREFYFLAIYSQYSSVDIETILEAIDAPNRYKRALKNIPKIPKDIKNSFVASLAIKNGVSTHPLSYHPIIKQKAKALNVWDRAFDIGITPADLIKEGFKGKALGDELKRIQNSKLQELDYKD